MDETSREHTKPLEMTTTPRVQQTLVLKTTTVNQNPILDRSPKPQWMSPKLRSVWISKDRGRQLTRLTDGSSEGPRTWLEGLYDAQVGYGDGQPGPADFERDGFNKRHRRMEPCDLRTLSLSHLMPRHIPSCLHSRPTPSVALSPFLFSHPSIARHHERSPRELSGDRSDVAESARLRTTFLHPSLSLQGAMMISTRSAQLQPDVTETQDLFLARATWGTAVKRTGWGFRTGRPNGSRRPYQALLAHCRQLSHQIEPSQGSRTAQRIMSLTREGGDQDPCLERVKTAAEGQDEPRLASGV
ncbi:hypothetical protein G6F33_006353 [Rhizopus arrhizus]|nr:hypothetical protein G6F23_008867 [Rhizopus arrhizus]KAG0912156.1 hypothetical protein G6F33_006353 [Rhizopus arrhizus]KAG1291582.1 hypothetical protein G6F66_007701 [Rhizopus arrhizus]